MSTVTTATATVPTDGHVRACTAATACPVTILGADQAEARRMSDQHRLDAHGIPIPKRRKP